jgi:DNA-binding beta-propeller fold protein YncE
MAEITGESAQAVAAADAEPPAGVCAYQRPTPPARGKLARLKRGRALPVGAIPLATLIAFVTVGWEHAYHTVSLGLDESLAGHVVHILRDGALVWPLALIAAVVGLRFTGTAARAAGTSVVMGLLLVPSVEIHERIDGALSGAHEGAHHHEEGGSGLLGMLEHGVHDALFAQVVLIPLAFLVFTVVAGRARPRVEARPLRNRLMLGPVCLVLLGVVLGGLGLTSETSVPAAGASDVKVIDLTDNPGNWFDTGQTIAGTRSLTVVQPGTTLRFNVAKPAAMTVHTATSLLYPTGASSMPFDQDQAFRGTEDVTLSDPGLYVFLCKLHPFMLGGAIVDDPGTPELDLGKTITFMNGDTVPTASDRAIRYVRSFLNITSPGNYQVHSAAHATTWDPVYPAVPVRAYGKDGQPVVIPDLDAFLGNYFHEPITLPKATAPTAKGVGEVWVDTEYEKTAHKTKPGTATAVDAATWKVTKKFALPKLDFNNGHNMWTDRDQNIIYNTEWFGNRLVAFDRLTGKVVGNREVGEAPAHVMTRVDTDQVHTTLNGEGDVVELEPGATSITRRIPVQGAGERPGQPHAHWMGPDGHTMSTPNSNTDDSTLLNIPAGTITSKLHTGTLPIASGMMPDASKYYVSNFIDSTMSVVDMSGPQQVTKTIDLLENYDPISGDITGPIGGLPIQTPVDPTGKYVVQANTLTATITFIDTDTDTLVKSLPCDYGCHGANFGAKKGGGYLLYISSKFSNTMMVVDPDPNNDGDPTDAKTLGRIVLTSTGDTKQDDNPIEHPGMGGQGVLPVPVVYNGWVQNVPDKGSFTQLTCEQRHPIGGGGC